ncbi:hypothetical protein V8C42DRAFT_335059 [Trichoderma barbatum]
MGFQSQYTPEGRGGDIEGQRSRSTTVTRSEAESEYYSSSRGRDRDRDNSKRTAPDRGSVYQASGTFYREGTPPPPQTRDTNLDASSTTNILQKAGEFYDYQYDHIAPPAPIPSATICGVTTRLFWIALAIAGLLVAIGVGVGVGVGLGGRNHKSSAESSPATTSTGTHTPTLISTSTSTSKTASATHAPSSHLLSCPNANGTKFDVPNSEKTFQLLCGIDYTGVDEATELASVYTVDMEDCMTNCANYPGCTGCGWGVIPGDEGSLHRCWLKGSLKKTHQSKTGWYFAILEGS